MKLFTTRQIAEIDRYTIENEPISDIDLMERASMAITDRLIRLTGRQCKLIFLAGPGNNGGDALAVARLMSEAGYPCEVFLPEMGSSGSRSQQINLERLKDQAKAKIFSIRVEQDFPRPEPGSIIIDGLFGSGLTRPLEGLAGALVRHINGLAEMVQIPDSRFQVSGSRRMETGASTPFDSLRLRSGTAAQGPPHSDPDQRALRRSEIWVEKRHASNTHAPLFEKQPLWNPETGDGRMETEEIRNRTSEIPVISIDLPSGLMGEDNSGNIPENIVRAHATITLQFPKLSLLFPENEQYAGKIFTEEIGLHPEGIRKMESPYRLTDRDEIYSWFTPRSRFAHKGDFGHALLVAGSYGKMGAALLASKACLKTGTGLVTTHLPACGYAIQQTYCPEVMCSIDPGHQFIMEIPPLKPYQAIAIGPGLGTRPETLKAISVLLGRAEVPVVWDADALNCLAITPLWLENLPQGTILTPHPGEFRRLFGETDNSWQRLQLLRKKAIELKVVIVLKGAYTAIALPDGNIWFNITGNPGMATGGSGDVLTGIILGLLAQGFSPEQAAIAGVYIHGEAGDHAASRYSQEALTASDITRSLPDVFQNISGWWQSDFSYF
jgi:NAD(P)H-hydrate epimerase